jgi:hypothetical protein
MLRLLTPALLWSGAVLLYGAGRWHPSLGSPKARVLLAWSGGALVLAGVLVAVSSATGWGAGLSAALVHFTAAASFVAVAAPLLSRRKRAMVAVASCGVLVGVLEAVS